jgi:hypothetical protein
LGCGLPSHRIGWQLTVRSLYRMSLISDALRKAELQRSNPELNHVSGWDRRTGSSPTQSPPMAAPKRPRALMFANIGVLALLCVVAVYFFRDQPMGAATETLSSDSARETENEFENSTTGDSFSDFATSAREAAELPPPETSTSPFLPPAVASAERLPTTEEYSLVGTSSLGSNTLISVVRVSDRRSMWIPVGKTVGEVTAVSYDPDTDRAVIRVRGNLLTITMDVLPPAAPESDAEEAANSP